MSAAYSNLYIYEVLTHLECAAQICADPTIDAPSPIAAVLDAWAIAEPFLLDDDCDPDLPRLLRGAVDAHPGLFAAADAYRQHTEAGWPLCGDPDAVRALFVRHTGTNPFAAPF